MKANVKRRVLCYLLDVMIVISIGFLLSVFLPKSNEYLQTKQEIGILSENYLNHEISFSEYFLSYSSLVRELDKGNMLYLWVCFGIMVLYFIIVPLFLGGRTFGMWCGKLIVQNKGSFQNIVDIVLIRSSVSYGVLYFLFELMLIFLISGELYFILLTILAILQILVVICSLFMIKYRDDKRSLADILSHSNILIES